MKKLLIFFLLGISFSAFCQTKIVVSQDGTGNFKTVQEALNAVPLHNTKTVTIYIKDGVYHEKLRLDSSKNKVNLIGQDQFKTILTYDDHPGKTTSNGKPVNTQNSYSFLVAADDLHAENITFQNDAGFTAGQSVALEIRGDRAILKNCRVVGNQDILFLSRPNTRQYFKDCYIEGTTDFIFGPSAAWFQNCHIHSKKNSHITAASTPQDHSFGFVFNNCVITADTNLNKVSLGRPWRPYASVTYLHCYLPEEIKPEGWSAWNQLDTYALSRYSEYEDYGPGANTENRVYWSHQLTSAEAQKFTLKNVFGDWKPE